MAYAGLQDPQAGPSPAVPANALTDPNGITQDDIDAANKAKMGEFRRNAIPEPDTGFWPSVAGGLTSSVAMADDLRARASEIPWLTIAVVSIVGLVFIKKL